ncbi:hypothetical protein ABH007_08810 [Bacteroides thetaiotaomicron]|jgi:hypothetical protein|uniref:hypothetical protein n=1 Tax=Bacteroides thetaiotaomicron TaxID=818 RepID=UPI00232E629B|nr:hypothetical protein [Bacteroides thetaiotaomicron]MDC2011529.1 hypothetical protein [Bacteroides thetaiotaomicron]MDC2017402.1 hypothetical protein [Bacteroides thetaiotaomicron]MDC2033866.1 hypothetical protein [Bacteroides thetaiotaomicron]MDC2038210.1 hypothetical protein [Bacteroides thetaiotaomicron]MDC2042698.1 hypothetical protein [Bacteroides thetaiotaomicron]
MENNGFITILWILWIVAVVVQLVVAVKFFDMASDIKAMKEMMQQSMRMKQGEDDINSVEDIQIPKVDPKKFRWQMWMYIAIAVLGLLLYILS